MLSIDTLITSTLALTKLDVTHSKQLEPYRYFQISSKKLSVKIVHSTYFNWHTTDYSSVVIILITAPGTYYKISTCLDCRHPVFPPIITRCSSRLLWLWWRISVELYSIWLRLCVSVAKWSRFQSDVAYKLTIHGTLKLPTGCLNSLMTTRMTTDLSAGEHRLIVQVWGVSYQLGIV